MVPDSRSNVEGSVWERVVGKGHCAGCVGCQRGENAGTETREAEVALDKAEEREEAEETATENWIELGCVTVSGQHMPL